MIHVYNAFVIERSTLVDSKEDAHNPLKRESKIDDCSNPENFPLMFSQTVGRSGIVDFYYSTIHGLVNIALKNGDVQTYII